MASGCRVTIPERVDTMGPKPFQPSAMLACCCWRTAIGPSPLVFGKLRKNRSFWAFLCKMSGFRVGDRERMDRSRQNSFQPSAIMVCCCWPGGDVITAPEVGKLAKKGMFSLSYGNWLSGHNSRTGGHNATKTFSALGHVGMLLLTNGHHDQPSSSR